LAGAASCAPSSRVRTRQCAPTLSFIDLYLLYQIKLSEDIMDNLWTTYVFEITSAAEQFPAGLRLAVNSIKPYTVRLYDYPAIPYSRTLGPCVVP
jgi:hypothetical protein